MLLRLRAGAHCALANGFIDIDLIREHVHTKSVVPPHCNQMPSEIFYFPLNSSLAFGADETLMPAYAALCMTALSLTPVQHVLFLQTNWFNNKVPTDCRAKQMPLFNILGDSVACLSRVIILRQGAGGMPLQRGQDNEAKILRSVWTSRSWI